jgi:hypothetical protein
MGILGLACFVFFTRFYFFRKELMEHGIETEAEITEIIKDYASNDDDVMVLGYNVDGRYYESKRTTNRPRKTGEKVKILCKADRPEKFIFIEQKTEQKKEKKTVNKKLESVLGCILFLFFSYVIIDWLLPNTDTIELTGNRAHGDNWSYTISPKGIVYEVKGKYNTNDNFIYKFKSIKKGEAEIVFNYSFMGKHIDSITYKAIVGKWKKLDIYVVIPSEVRQKVFDDILNSVKESLDEETGNGQTSQKEDNK